MGSRGMLLLKGAIPINQMFNHRCNFSKVFVLPRISRAMQHYSTARISSSLEPPDVPSLAEIARISLTPQEVEEFTPKIRQVVDWFGQLQDVELHSVEPALRADMEYDNLREDIPETFSNREAIISGIPNYEEPYIKVPKVLNKE